MCECLTAHFVCLFVIFNLKELLEASFVYFSTLKLWDYSKGKVSLLSSLHSCFLADIELGTFRADGTQITLYRRCPRDLKVNLI